MKNGRDRNWFTLKEAAAYIGVHRDTIYNYIKRKKNRPPFKRFTDHGPYRFPKEQFIEWADGPTKKG
jgi:excisionase family DNA binding protein